jgi:hypothetical protein
LDKVKKLQPTQMDASARMAVLPSTRQEILRLIIDWVLSPTQTHNILWLFGVAGSGKSVLSTTIAGYFRELGRLGAFLFFDRDVIERSDPSNVIRTLAYQLADFDDDFTEAISKKASRLSWQWPIQTQFDEFLVKALSTIPNVVAQGPVVIVLDALDECGTAKTRRVLLSLLAEQFLKLPSNLRIIITSRAEHDIHSAFSSQPNIKSMELDVSTTASTKDVQAYFRYWMSVIRSSNRLLQLSPDWPGESKILELAERSSGLFIWASTVIAFIEDGHDPEERLRVVLGTESRGTVESVLDGLYTTALQACKWKDETFRSDFVTIMGTILAARDPILPSTIDALMKPSRPSLHTISHLGCVVHWGTSQPLRILHPSFADFLTNRDRHANDDWFIDLAIYHHRLTRQCLQFLTEELPVNAGETGSIQHSGLPEGIKYASIFWIEHFFLVDGDVTTLLEDLECFIGRHLLHWFEVMSMIGRASDIVPTLGRLLEWLEVRPSAKG